MGNCAVDDRRDASCRSRLRCHSRGCNALVTSMHCLLWLLISLLYSIGVYISTVCYKQMRGMRGSYIIVWRSTSYYISSSQHIHSVIQHQRHICCVLWCWLHVHFYPLHLSNTHYSFLLIVSHLPPSALTCYQSRPPAHTPTSAPTPSILCHTPPPTIILLIFPRLDAHAPVTLHTNAVYTNTKARAHINKNSRVSQ